MTAPDSWLATLEELGGFFSLAAAPDATSGAVPWPDVLAEPALTGRFAAVRAVLAEGASLPAADLDPKVAVSAVQVSLASRLWSVALAGAALHGWVPALTGDNLVASPEHRGPVPLGLRDPDAGYAVSRPADAARLVGELVVEAGLADLETACSRVGRTPRRVLASNSTSALVGGARVLARLRPDRAAATWSLTRSLLDHPAVAAGGGTVDPDGLPVGVGGPMERPDEAFLRSGCCVFYRLPEHGLCPDCVLAPSRPEQVTPGH
ncbi:(2Fe-2S)-binding protein [Ornithinimicrobium flavum]|uniref:(2Fe-2S)-binding protein n=1 Tax=Ornithinimicrobium flavum TaxID=1288636 RepID=UPI00106FD202|nr:(2Fe-2S)-binding protein [Ornithinimicrobium flavum]